MANHSASWSNMAKLKLVLRRGFQRPVMVHQPGTVTFTERQWVWCRVYGGSEIRVFGFRSWVSDCVYGTLSKTYLSWADSASSLCLNFPISWELSWDPAHDLCMVDSRLPNMEELEFSLLKWTELTNFSNTSFSQQKKKYFIVKQCERNHPVGYNKPSGLAGESVVLLHVPGIGSGYWDHPFNCPCVCKLDRAPWLCQG
jgi:hypothetical protein